MYLIHSMYTSNVKILITLLMLMAFIGQTLAVGVASCEMHQSDGISSHSVDNMHANHMDHVMPELPAQDSSSGCCDDEINCDMSGCVLVVLSYDDDSSINTPVSENINSEPSLIASSPSKSLYRPPILS